MSNNNINTEYIKEEFNSLYNDLIRDERKYVSGDLTSLTHITEDEFIDKYEEEVDNIPLNKILPSHYKSLRVLYEFFNKEEEEEESEEV